MFDKKRFIQENFQKPPDSIKPQDPITAVMLLHLNGWIPQVFRKIFSRICEDMILN